MCVFVGVVHGSERVAGSLLHGLVLQGLMMLSPRLSAWTPPQRCCSFMSPTKSCGSKRRDSACWHTLEWWVWWQFVACIHPRLKHAANTGLYCCGRCMHGGVGVLGCCGVDGSTCAPQTSHNAFRRVRFVRQLSRKQTLALAVSAEVVLDPFPVGLGSLVVDMYAGGKNGLQTLGLQWLGFVALPYISPSEHLMHRVCLSSCPTACPLVSQWYTVPSPDQCPTCGLLPPPHYASPMLPTSPSRHP